jgi:ribonuclease HII
MGMITDSKKLNAQKREHLTEQLLACPDIIWATSFVSASYIDRYGIVPAIRKASLDVIDQIIQKTTPLL